MDKEIVVQTVREWLKGKIEELERNISEVQNSANQESKSSMGDKYETGRAMAQNEVFMLQNQLANLSQEAEKFNVIDFSIQPQNIIAGSLVETNIGWFLLSSGLGKVTIAGKPIMCISLNSPLSITLLGKQANESFVINNKAGKVLTVL